ncbi:MAG TPA: hypothetical protein PLF40_00410 [Kofleriaceae bacterium]|nr:hypothetical protein [Kofleriaceae bacterium]
MKRPLTPYGEPTDSLELERVTRVDDDELPVVARLVVEIRSDGSRTIARGGLEDAALGQRVTVEARGDSPLQLALALAKSLGALPTFRRDRVLDGEPAKPRSMLRTALGARKLVRGMLGKKK